MLRLDSLEGCFLGEGVRDTLRSLIWASRYSREVGAFTLCHGLGIQRRSIELAQRDSGLTPGDCSVEEIALDLCRKLGPCMGFATS